MGAKPPVTDQATYVWFPPITAVGCPQPLHHWRPAAGEPPAPVGVGCQRGPMAIWLAQEGLPVLEYLN
jgi:hypothetical protein